MSSFGHCLEESNSAYDGCGCMGVSSEFRRLQEESRSLLISFLNIELDIAFELVRLSDRESYSGSRTHERQRAELTAGVVQRFVTRLDGEDQEKISGRLAELNSLISTT